MVSDKKRFHGNKIDPEINKIEYPSNIFSVYIIYLQVYMEKLVSKEQRSHLNPNFQV